MIHNEYEILRRLTQVKDQPAHIIRGLTRFSKRMMFIIAQLSEVSCSFEIDSFDMGHNGWYKNIIAYPTDFDDSKNTIILMAHHDVFDTSHENANDNSASVSILLSLLEVFNKLILDVNVVVIFTDDEEVRAFGSQRVTDQIFDGKFGHVLHVINLELSGIGENIWVEDTEYNNFVLNLLLNSEKFAGEIQCPFNDASNIRRWGFTQATTVGMLDVTDGEFDTSVWNNIHSSKDKFDLIKKDSLFTMKTFLLNSIIKLHDNETE